MSAGYGNGYSTVVDIGDDTYLVQGAIEDPIVMFRTVDELLECERDNVQLMMEEVEDYE